MRSGSVGVIDGVFVWKLDPDSHIILYDSVYGRFWDLKLTDEMDDWTGSAVGVSDGVLYYALCNRREITRKAIGSIRIKMLNIDIHSVNSHIFYLLAGDKVISYDSEKNTAEFLYEIGVSVCVDSKSVLLILFI
ncbi:hypothetical protein H5410_024792 [Solanum commersonii]|uniref:Uncharacterized protein n=1 Tax=Solanum commersonii TaxID=4109 RepID=A0A9J5ZN40_SOLCO|nr:hypothetical protein H5410_024792 [Solanum commersonii]